MATLEPGITILVAENWMVVVIRHVPVALPGIKEDELDDSCKDL